MMRKFTIPLLAVLMLVTLSARAERIKDIVTINGVRSNPLWGTALVVGLNGTGDDSPLGRQMLTSILRQGGTRLLPTDITSQNIAVVVVTAELPAFSRKNSRIDVTVSTVDDSTSLRGGTLIMAPLKGADGQTYAVAQGSLSVGGFGASGQSASVTKGHPTVARIANGATVEREELSDFVENGRITLQLQNPDFATAEGIAKAINKVFPKSSHAVDGGTVQVEVPKTLTKAKLVGFVRDICKLEVEVDMPAVVVINEKTGTIVVGKNVSISMVAVAHGSLSIVTKESDKVSQPKAFSETGTTTTTHETEIDTMEEGGFLHRLPRSVSVAELARALNAMGLTPMDLVAVFNALSKAGALQATLKVM
ncbi:MAG: flagellar basal body P-ring protein FlgI [bacterium]|nr:flagellar basal body P-ring protein FlgI [bacterium]